MATIAPQPLAAPPPSSIPTISIPKPRTTSLKTSETSRIPSAPRTAPRIAQRTSSRPSKLNPTTSEDSKSTPSVPTLQSLSTTSQAPALPSGDLRRSVSIAAFPSPPKVQTRIATSPRPSASATWPTLQNNIRDSEDPAIRGILAAKPKIKKLKTKSSSNALSQMYTSSQSPTLLNKSGNGKSVISTEGHRVSDGINSLHSPAHSRSSSPQGSCSTSATTFEDIEDAARRGRDAVENSKTTSKPIPANKEGKGNVIVGVRVRPDVAANGDNRSEGEWLVDGRRSLISYHGREGGDYYYDNVFAPHDKNNKVYDASAKRLVRRVMEGYHGTVFAYGMTGTGKTFSMQGTASSPGVIPLAIADIFSYIRETPHREFLLRVSYLEIYNERIHDLLSPAAAGGSVPGVPPPEEIKLREDSKRGVYASPLKEEIVQSPTQLLRVIARGDHSRRTRSTQYNAQSSRSHAVVQIVVESRERTTGGSSGRDNKRAPLLPGGVRVSTLSMIDLAGSERAAESKERRTEGAHINKSLLTLGTVIARLSGEKDSSGKPTDKDGKHLPYRDSKLTRLLQPALSGDSLISILCTIQIGSAGSVATATGHTGETLNTLKFAARAKNNIVSHAKRAQEAIPGASDAGSRVLLERYRVEIQGLRQQLEGQGKAQHDVDEEKWEKEAGQRHEEQMLEIQLARTALKERIEHLNRLIISSKSSGVNSGQLASSLHTLHSKRDKLTTISDTSTTPPSARSSAGISTLQRTTSTGSSVTVGAQTAGQSPTSSNNENGLGCSEEENLAGEYGDGKATAKAQVRALQADLADKNRYISTLEKRLLQARRSSNSRTSLTLSSPTFQRGNSLDGEEGRTMTLLREKDAEIADLRARLEDKERMVMALRSAARQRGIAEATSSSPSEPKASKMDKEQQPQGRKGSDESMRSVGNGSYGAKSPVELLAPQKERDLKRKSMDEMSRMLDEMIQGRVQGAAERKKEVPPSGTAVVPRLGALAASLRPTSTVSEGEAGRHDNKDECCI
ncbi:MAG: hypothetical protein L6R37_003918 [Teloschistes peruensis]|nr:MAG: hypothetical protein L6R37_003918 [Teloschistes peruensis]